MDCRSCYYKFWVSETTKMAIPEGLFLAVWSFLPAWLANSAPLLISKMVPKKFRKPIDLGKSLADGNRMLGDGKTFTGFLAGIAAGTAVGLVQGNPTLGGLLGLGAMLGDTAGSFVRRRLGAKRGENVPVLNQLDFVAGALLLSSQIWHWGAAEIAAICIITVPMHRLTNWVAYKLGIKAEPW